MAKAKKPSDIPITDRSYFYSDLAFMPEDVKQSRLWMAQALFFAKLNGTQFEDPKRLKRYRDLSNMILNRQEYVNMIDPPTPMAKGGTATYFASDFKANPIDIHLDNIVRARLDKIGFENKLTVNEIDKFSKPQRQLDKDKIIYQREFRNLINIVNKEVGMPPISESESPYEYVKRLQGEKDGGQMVDELAGIIDHIRMQIKDAHDLALYNRYVYKGDIERAFEMGIQHYLINQNKWRIKSEFFIDDLKNFNRAAGEWYIDQTTGRGVVSYLEPDRLFTSPFYDKDGDDIIYWFYEKDITFADFIRRFGTTLDEDKLKQIFALNKYSSAWGAGHMMDWGTGGIWDGSASNNVRNNALIRVGQFHILTQEDNRFAENYVNDMIPSWERKPLTWQPEKDSDVPKRKVYNVWYSCYYVPPPGEKLSRNAQASWSWQSDYIFDIEKDTDMYRYGVDRRYAKSSLVVWKDIRPSFMDIKQGFMPKINTLWHKFQNAVVNDVSAVGIDQDFLGSILNAADEANKIDPANPDEPTGGNGVDAGLEVWKMLRQGGMGWLKMRDKNGNIIPGLDPSKFVVTIDNKLLDKAEKYLQMILQLYEAMKLALAQSDISEGQSPKPRTPVEGLQASLQATKEGLWFIEKPVREFMIMFGERCVQMILNFRKETSRYKFTKRWQEFEDVVGLAQALMVEGIEDMNAEEIGLTIELEDTSAWQDYIFQMANQLVKNKEIGLEAAGLVIDTAKYNYKYAWALMCMAVDQRAAIAAQQEALAYNREMEKLQMQLQIAQSLQGAKTQGKLMEIEKQGQIDAQVDTNLNQQKNQTMLQQQQQRGGLKMQQDVLKNQLDKDKISHEKVVESAFPPAKS